MYVEGTETLTVVLQLESFGPITQVGVVVNSGVLPAGGGGGAEQVFEFILHVRSD